MKVSEKHKMLLELNGAMDTFYEDNERLDYCGAFCNNDKFSSLLLSPTKQNACSILRNLVDRKLYIYENVNFSDDESCRKLFTDFYNNGIYFSIDYSYIDDEQ